MNIIYYRRLLEFLSNTGLFFVLLLVAATKVSGAAPSGKADHPTDRRIDAAITRALEWIDNHRATVDDGGLTDMIDEGVAFRFFWQHSQTELQRQRYLNRLHKQMESLHQLAEFKIWVERPHKPLIDHYHLVLAAHLSKIAGLSSPLITTIAEQARQALTTVRFDSPTVRLTTAAFLLRLDDNIALDMEVLRSRSMIEQLHRYPHLISLPTAGASAQQLWTVNWWLYALVHEIVALTDFGQLPVSAWLAERRHAVVGVLEEAVTWAGTQRNHDLLAEIAVTLYLLQEPLKPQLRVALDTLLADQQPDGSWGASTMTTRQNKLRHTVLTATAALLAYRQQLNTSQHQRR